ncbi:MAG: hypothetical protein ACJ741_05055 [Pyrinomonadaceae bacterium]
MSAVISTACAWCMIIPCMNSTSFGERGGSCALVSGGSRRVGCPGAPGCTTTGGDCGSACRARADGAQKQARAQVTTSAIRDAATLLTGRNLSLILKGDDCIGIAG